MQIIDKKYLMDILQTTETVKVVMYTNRKVLNLLFSRALATLSAWHSAFEFNCINAVNYCEYAKGEMVTVVPELTRSN